MSPSAGGEGDLAALDQRHRAVLAGRHEVRDPGRGRRVLEFVGVGPTTTITHARDGEVDPNEAARAARARTSRPFACVRSSASSSSAERTARS